MSLLILAIILVHIIGLVAFYRAWARAATLAVALEGLFRVRKWLLLSI